MLRVELDEVTINRIRDCKRNGFPICLEEALSIIFKESAGEAMMERIIAKLDLQSTCITSARQVWEIYDRVLSELAKELGKDVSNVIKFQSIVKMESKPGCTGCFLYKREICKKIIDSD